MALHFASSVSLRCSLHNLITSRATSRVGRWSMALAVLAALGVPALRAQTTAPVVLPNTFSTVAGGLTTAQTAGAACATNSRYTATDIYGNGCPATQSLLGQDLHQGVALDGQGNIYINDANNFTSGVSVQMLRRVDAKTGIITSVLSSLNGACTAATSSTLGSTDSYGDGCATSVGKYAKERAIAVDPYGNVLIGSYGSGYVRIVCNAVSPLCPVAASATNTYATAQKQVGFTYRIAGCDSAGSGATSSATSTSAGTAGDGYYASAFENLPGDAANWNTAGNPTGFTAVAPTVAPTGGTCSGNVGLLNASAAVTADQYGNVFIHDGGNQRARVIVGPATFTLPSGTVLTNPWPAIIKLNATYSAFTAAQMYGRIFPILGGYAATTVGQACGTSTAKDIYGDSCPWYFTSQTNANPAGLAISNSGDLLFQDGKLKVLRVLYIGASVATSTLTSSSVNPMAYAIFKNNNTLTTITQGNVYVLAGLGGSGQSTTSLTLGSSTILANGSTRVAVGPNGNIFIGSGSNSLGALVGFYDLSTGYVRTAAASNGGTNATITVDGGPIVSYFCAAASTGDGTAAYTNNATPGTTACFQDNGTGSGSLGIAVDAQNNLYIADAEPSAAGGNISQSTIRKVLASQLYPTAEGSSTTQIIRIHSQVGTTAGATDVAAALENAPSGISIGTPACGASLNADSTADCFATATFAPTQPGVRKSTLALTPTGASVTAATVPFFGMATGSALVADPNATGSATATAATSSVGTLAGGAVPTQLALDSAGDVFTIDTGNSKFTEVTAGGTTTQLGGTVPSTPNQIALDPAGNLYAVGSSSTSVTVLPLTATGYAVSSSSITVYDPAAVSSTLSPRAVTFDQAGNMYFATTSAVYELPYATLISGVAYLANQPGTLIANGFNSIKNLAIDGFGGLVIADTGASKIFRIDAKTGAQTTLATGVNPVALSADTAGNVYYQDGTAKTFVVLPFSGVTSTSILTGLNTPSGAAVAGNGVVYSADAGTAVITKVARNVLAYNFGTVAYGNTGATLGLTVDNVGNLTSTGYAATDAGEFPLTTGATSGCGTLPNASNGNTTANVLSAGGACTLTATFVPANGTSTVNSINTLLPAASTTGNFTLTGTEAGATAPTTTTTIAGPSTAGYSASATEATYTVTVTASNSGVLTGGTVNVSVDGGTAVAYTLNSNNQATVPVSGLVVKSHPITATFPNQAISSQSYGTSTSNTINLTITQASTSVTYTPATTTVPYSSNVTANALNATAASSGSAVPGVFVYTATGSDSVVREIHAASYLAVGSYTLNATFYPTDNADYASSTATGGTFTVTQATTTAGLGATQTMVAADGTGNYTAIQTAIQSLSSTLGGNVYIKPGTYTGTFTVNAPNVSLRGLGGDPTAVVLTHSYGAFSPAASCGSSPGNCYAGEFQAAGENNTFTGDEGSATLVVARSAIPSYASGATLTPYAFYAENFTLANTYDTDNVTTTTTYVPGSGNTTCTAGNATPQTYQYLYNHSMECASQALAIWITADQAVLNNVYTASAQDTIYAGAISGSSGQAARQYWFRGKVTGNVDYIFGDAAAVFDHTTIFTIEHGTTGGTITIEAQNKAAQSGSAGDYLSGYIMNSTVFTSDTSNLTQLLFGRPYGKYSTWVMLNSYVDQVTAGGYIEFSGNVNLPTSTYSEYYNGGVANYMLPDPANGSRDINGVLYTGAATSYTAGLTATRETTSNNPGTLQVASGGTQVNYMALANTSLGNFEAQQYYPLAFLGQTVPTNPYNNGVTKWDPTAAIASKSNAFVSGGVASIAPNSSVTILMRPQTPGLGAINGGTVSAPTVTFTVPTGTYTLTDTFNSNTTTLATGTLDNAGEAYFSTSTLAPGTHNLSWTYSGDSNFIGSTATSYMLTVQPYSTVTTLSIVTNPITYGQSASVTATVTPPTGTATGNVTLYVDGAANATQALSSGSTTFTVAGLAAGSHAVYAAFAANSTYSASTSSTMTLTVNKATLTVTGVGANRLFNQPNTLSFTVAGYQYADTATTVIATGPTVTTTATRDSVAGSYTVVPAATLTAFGAANYTLVLANGTFTIAGGTPQSVIFDPLPNFASGASYQLTARSTSGLTPSYTVVSGPATVTGATLTVTGPGAVTVQASTITDPTGDYAAPTPVSRTFTAQ